MDVRASTVACRDRAEDQACPLEDIEMVGEQVAGKRVSFGEFPWCAVTGGKVIDDGEPVRVAESCVYRSSELEVARVHDAIQPRPINSLNQY